jgi:hypothetical protein
MKNETGDKRALPYGTICKSLEQTILKYFPQIETDVDRPKSSSVPPSPTKEAADLVHFIARTNRCRRKISINSRSAETTHSPLLLADMLARLEIAQVTFPTRVVPVVAEWVCTCPAKVPGR